MQEAKDEDGASAPPLIELNSAEKTNGEASSASSSAIGVEAAGGVVVLDIEPSRGEEESGSDSSEQDSASDASSQSDSESDSDSGSGSGSESEYSSGERTEEDDDVEAAVVPSSTNSIHIRTGTTVRRNAPAAKVNRLAREGGASK